MKKIKSLLYIAIVISSISVALTSCATDKCKDVVCQNDGICLEGTCDCASGYEGTFCEDAFNKKFSGTWTVNETCNGTVGTPYTVIIAASSTDPKLVSMQDLGNYSCSSGSYQVPATIDGSNISVSGTQCSTVFTGSGSINADANSISLTYAATYGSPSTTDNCTATLTK